MKHTLYLILALAAFLASCQSQENSRQTEPDTVPADTTAAQPPKPPAPDSTYLIVPGGSIGKVKVGMYGEALARILGEPDSSDAAMGKALYFWEGEQPAHYVSVFTVTDFGGQVEKPVVQQVQITSPRFLTKDSIGTGMPLSEIRQKYGPLRPLAYFQNAQRQQVYIFDNQAQGIAFEVTLPDSLCSAITVHPKGEDMADIYLPLHPDMTRIK